jgi:two-component system CheB/CheR fusion protein
MPVMIVAFDEQERTVAWNRESERVTGYPAKDMIGKCDALGLLAGAANERKLLGKHPVQTRSLTCKDGTLRHVLWLSMSHGVPVPWSECWIGVDVTDQPERSS